MSADAPTADAFKAHLETLQSDAEREKYNRYFKMGEGEYGEGDVFMGVRMGHVFEAAEAFLDMDPAEIELLLESGIHEHRAGAVSIMARQYKRKGTTPERRDVLHELYLRRHDRINNWDLVDLGAWHVVGPHLVDKPRDLLYRLSRSPNMWERRTAILATFAFIKRKDYADTLAIADILRTDPEDLIHKATGWMLRCIPQDDPALIAFLDAHAATMPRALLRAALEKFPKDRRAHYMALGKQARA
ncbi:DNA alkylation repair protein [Pelagibacterium xiamenense]|uniref:DNA alkylation repair protein n=1 Tax=Pelagibacterium xiamenense TaxID=2901140 RepID=UPI001E360204|nr:DNA alkylation repair protein [Pelagibacterium xiamenense]MCD7059456.1 DNA alkylation repair protein [Pelagibacterium xiamenense]